jgi:hypothetical protein
VVGEYTSELTAGAWEAWQYLSAQPSPSGQDALELLIARWRADAAEAATSDNTLCQKIANCTMRHAAELAAALAARQPVEFERAVPTRRRESAVELLLQLGFVWNNQRWEDRRQPVGQEPVAHRVVTGDPKRKWMVVQGAPSVGVIRQAQDYGWEVECFYSHTFKPATPPWAAPPAQAVDLGQFSWAVELARQHHSHGSPLNEQVIAECDRLLALINKAVGNK